MTPRRCILAGVLAGLALAPGAAAQPASAPAGPDHERGRAVFAAKHCARCHGPQPGQGAGPPLEVLRRPQGAFELAGRLWNHAPAMLAALVGEQLAWPQIDVAEMRDLMAYLGAEAGRDPAVSLSRGRVALLRKGCLKCHSLHGEGAPHAPELARPLPVYRSADAWASHMWTHAPKMATKAGELGVLYPRFIDSEMGNLVAFLRSEAGER